MIISEALTLYLVALQENDYSPAHLASAGSRLRNALAAWLDEPLTAVSRNDLRIYLHSLKQKGRAEATLAGYTASLKAFFNWCIAEGLLTQSPAEGLKKRDYAPVHRRAAPAADVVKVAAVLTEFADSDNELRNLRDALFISFVIDSGARLGEIHSLRSRDLEHSLARGVRTSSGRVGYAVAGEGKTGSKSVVYFAETAVFARRWLAERPFPEASHVFSSLKTGELLRPGSLGRAFERVCAFAEVPVFRAHAVRKRNVTEVIKLSGDLTVGQRYAGHTSIETTMRHYNDIVDEDIIDAAATLADQRRLDEVHKQLIKLFKK